MRRREYLTAIGTGIGAGVPAVAGASASTSGGASDGFAVSITSVNDPVKAGDVLSVRAEIDNTGSRTATQDVRLIAGETVDAKSVEVPAGDWWTVDLSYETYPVTRDVEFPVTVATDDDRDERVVQVLAEDDGDLEIEITETNAPVRAGEVLRTRVTVRNTGRVTQTQTVELSAGGTVDSETVTVPSDEIHSFSLSYETYPVARDVEFDVTASTEDDSDARSVTVYGAE